MAYIELFEGQTALGQFDLPLAVSSDPKTVFRLGRARKGGGNGIVFDARQYDDHSMRRTCAVKFLRRLDPGRVDRFNNEIRVVNNLKHNNIAEYYGHGEARIANLAVPWMAQELGGRNLREHVDSTGALRIDLMLSVASQMCHATEHLHQAGFIHRDIKPDNFVWVENSATEVIMIDLGIAKRMDEDVSARPMDMLTRTLEFVGPVFFSSPELIAYAKDKNVPVDQRSDVFQLGKTIWFIATGRISSGVPSRNICPMNGRLRDLIVAAVDDDPGGRPQSALELRRAIEGL